MRLEASVEDQQQIAHLLLRDTMRQEPWRPTVADLRAATALGQWEVHYQPIVHMRTRACVGAEALLRWNHPVFGPITPQHFILEAERSGEIIPMTRWLISRVMRDLQWLSNRGIEIYAGINLAAQHFRSTDIIDDLLAATRRTGVLPRKILLELTERDRIDDGTNTPGEIMNHLTECGFRLAIDDFGAHDSSLTYLAKFPISQIKIDKSFVDGIESNPRATSMLKGMVGLARSLNQTLVAEGVQTRRQLELLAKIGVTLAQGYVHARPMPVQTLEAYASKHDIPATRRVLCPPVAKAA
jgi:EAL domain-containing protein (putative c-di-GMP-specific phosphodiesterase class I)